MQFTTLSQNKPSFFRCNKTYFLQQKPPSCLKERTPMQAHKQHGSWKSSSGSARSSNHRFCTTSGRHSSFPRLRCFGVVQFLKTVHHCLHSVRLRSYSYCPATRWSTPLAHGQFSLHDELTDGIAYYGKSNKDQTPNECYTYTGTPSSCMFRFHRLQWCINQLLQYNIITWLC